MQNFETTFSDYMTAFCAENPDPSHDILHVKRVVKTAKKIAEAEGADLDVVIPAAYLHDCIYVSKTDPRRKQASRLSADKAVELLKEWGYPTEFHAQIHHAIVAHSFSANVAAETLEAKIVQDADRLDGIGAIGVARCFGLSGFISRDFYNDDDPFCERRTPDDSANSLDHFFVKLVKVPEKLHTGAAKNEGAKRTAAMNTFLEHLKSEIT